MALIYDLRLGAAYLTCEPFLEMNEKVPAVASPERQRVEQKLEYFDGPLKRLIIEYSRLVDPKALRSMAQLGKISDR
jgi:hypothetical protein